MGYMTDGLSLNVLRSANRSRRQEWPGSDKIDGTFHAIELGEEAGEVLGAIKKLLRAQRGITGRTATIEDVMKEMGDVLVVLDLLADKLGIDLNNALRLAFNRTSDEYGMRTRLGDTDWHLKPEVPRGD